VFLLNAGVALVWLAAAATMQRPSSLSSRLVPLGPLGKRRADELAARLSGVPGVAEAVVVADEEVAYLKVDRARLDEQALARAAAHG
jgi:multidrug efflux pump subunit AcrB